MPVLTANYHTHTYRCGHARGADRDYVENALGAGFTVLGFSDHSPMVFHSDHYSGFRMQPDAVPGYFESLTALREAYRGRIRILIGVETEYYPDSFDDYLTFMAGFPLDYKILGQHYIWKEENAEGAFKKTEDPRRLEEYYRNLLEAVGTGEFLYIAHPDVLNYAGQEDAYLDLTADFLRRVKPYGIPLEINRLGYSDGRHYPRRQFWTLAGQFGIPAVIGLDAHDPDVFSDRASVEGCLRFAEDCGVKVLESLDI